MIIHSITEESHIKFFIGKLNEVNQIMKKIAVSQEDIIHYNIDNLYFKSSFYDKNHIPRECYIYDYVFNKTQDNIIQSAIDKLSDYYGTCSLFPIEVPNAKALYDFIKDNKKYIISIDFEKLGEDTFQTVIRTKNDKIFYVLPSKDVVSFEQNYFIKDFKTFTVGSVNNEIKNNYKKFTKTLVYDEFLKKKAYFMLFLDLDKETIYIDNVPENRKDNNILPITLSHKYITGFSECNERNSLVTFTISTIYKFNEDEDLNITETEVENIYLVSMQISKGLKRTVENTFIVTDF